MERAARIRGVLADLAMTAGLAGGAVAQEVEIVVGVRADAAPFSYDAEQRSGPLSGTPREAGFRGYVADICSDVLESVRQMHRDDFSIGIVVVNAQNRFQLLRAGEADILCDPATITEERTRDLLASMPIYLSAVTYAAPKQFPLEEVCIDIVGVVSETTAEAGGIREILDSSNWARYADDIRSELGQVSGKAEAPVAASDCEKRAVRLYETHDALAADFCEGKLLYYVGDVEIVRRQLEDIDGCFEKSGVAPAVFTDERYAIFARADAAPGRAEIILDFYQELARQVYSRDDSILIESYEDNFEGYSASEKLQIFYWSVVGAYPD